MGCAAKCPSGSCTVLSPSYTSKSAWANGNSLYCYTVFVNEVGTAKSSNPKDLAILKYQKSNGVGIFGCDASSVFSDTTVDFGGASTTAVTPTGDWKKYMRKDKPTQYLNTPVFMGVWKQIKAEGTYASFSCLAFSRTVWPSSQRHRPERMLRHATKFLWVTLAILRLPAKPV